MNKFFKNLEMLVLREFKLQKNLKYLIGFQNSSNYY